MKIKLKTALCIVLIVCTALTSTAYAANETEATTRIIYTKEGESSGPPAAAASAASYEINIPAEVSLNAGRELYITANSMNLPAGASVVVSVDYERSYTEERTRTETGALVEDYYIKLLSTNGVDIAKVSINRHNYEIGAGEMMGRADSVAAVFTGNSLQPAKYGLLYLNLDMPGTIAPGTYSGNLYFNIELSYV